MSAATHSGLDAASSSSWAKQRSDVLVALGCKILRARHNDIVEQDIVVCQGSFKWPSRQAWEEHGVHGMAPISAGSSAEQHCRAAVHRADSTCQLSCCSSSTASHCDSSCDAGSSVCNNCRGGCVTPQSNKSRCFTRGFHTEHNLTVSCIGATHDQSTVQSGIVKLIQTVVLAQNQQLQDTTEHRLGTPIMVVTINCPHNSTDAAH